MIYDCFLYLNEAELLELRLHTLRQVVDRFVLVETHQTFAGRAKPCMTHERVGPLALVKEFGVVVHCAALPSPAPPGPFPFGGRWPCEYAMRNAIADALRPFAQPADHILISDVDEIPDPTCVWHRGTHLMRLFVYKLNALFSEDWAGTVGISYADLIYQTPQYFRAKNAEWPKIRSGWHFSYQGDAARRREKVMAGGDTAFDASAYLDQLEERAARLEDPMGRPPPAGLRPGRIVPLDASFPAYLREYPERFAGWVQDAGSTSQDSRRT